MLAINAYCFPVVRYAAGIVKWKLNNIQAMDRKTRELLTINRGLHPKSDVDLYLSRKKGGRGLQSIEDVVQEEKLLSYLLKSIRDPYEKQFQILV